MKIEISKSETHTSHWTPHDKLEVFLWDSVDGNAEIRVSYPGQTRMIRLSQLRALLKQFDGIITEPHGD